MTIYLTDEELLFGTEEPTGKKLRRIERQEKASGGNRSRKSSHPKRKKAGKSNR